MNESLSTALLLMVVGMITVFIILGLVVLTGKLLIKLVNKYIPEAEKFVPKQRKRPSSAITSFDKKKLAAIAAAVEIATAGKGRIVSIEKVRNDKKISS